MLVANFLVAQKVRVVAFVVEEIKGTVVVRYYRGARVTEPDSTSCFVSLYV